jgi:pimeloyl-ACP methyl ester carboxylesterase
MVQPQESAMKSKGIVFHGETRALDPEARASAPGRFVELPDGMVHYEIAGSAGAQTVVLIPGFSVPYLVWDPTFEALEQRGFRVLRYDLYGRGYSDRPDTTYDQDLFDRQLLNLLDALEIEEPIDLIGLSMGGAISVVFADRHPDSVRKLCLIGPAGLPWEQSLAAKLAQAPIIGEWIMGLLGDRVLVSNLRDYFHEDEGHAEFVERFRRQMQYIGYKAALLSSLRNGVTTGAGEAYERVGGRETPVMLIWGREDKVVPFELSERVLELMPNAEFHAIRDAAHIPHYERPDAVNPLLVEFLSR